MENMILQPIVVGGQTFKNRIMFPPLTTGYEKNGMISEQDMGFYTRLAKGESWSYECIYDRGFSGSTEFEF